MRPNRLGLNNAPGIRRILPAWASAAVWLTALLSPTGYFLLLMTADRLHVPALPESFVVLLFCVIPIVALLVCWAVVWLSKLRVPWRVGLLVLTVLAMLFQFGVLVVIVVSAITAAISPAQ
jgi:hypothetical protein